MQKIIISFMWFIRLLVLRMLLLAVAAKKIARDARFVLLLGSCEGRGDA